MILSKTVMFLTEETFHAYGRGICRGIARYAERNATWSLIWSNVIERASRPQSLPRIDPGEINGILMRITSASATRRIASLGIPVVDLLQDSHHRIPSFLADDDAVAKMAADFFIQEGFTNFAFCGYPGVPFSERRERAYRKELRRHRFECSCYSHDPVRRSNMLKEMQTGFHEIEELAMWAKTLRLPACILACNDVRAVQVLQACKLAKIAVPQSVAVLGVDNDELLVEFFKPRLSSIELDTDLTAFKACETLDKLMRGEHLACYQDYTGPRKLIERESTDTIATTDPIVSEAIRAIRKDACRGLRVKELMQSLRISRTKLEVRFNAVLGKTIHDVITETRVRRMSQILQTSDDPLHAIAARVGYSNVSHMSRVFRQATDMWPGEYRNRARNRIRLDSRYDELKSGKAKAIPGDESKPNFVGKSSAARSKSGS